MSIDRPPRYFDNQEMAEYYSELIRSLAYPTRPVAPNREDFKSHQSYGQALDEYESTLLKEWRDSVTMYREESNAIEAEFKKELLLRLDLSNHPKADKLYSMAWDRGHSSGFSEVVNVAESLAELLY